jgi:hypothetical protein
LIALNAAGSLSGVMQKTLILPPGASAVCDKCADDRKGKPTQGMEIIRRELKTRRQRRVEGGKILDPNRGQKNSACVSRRLREAKMEVRGYIGSLADVAAKRRPGCGWKVGRCGRSGEER